MKLETIIFAPKDGAKPLPLLLTRTPYELPEDERSLTAPGRLDDLIADGYIFVGQHVRGRFRSEGTFSILSPPRSSIDSRATDESTDAYDTIAWLLQNAPGNNGRVGMFGTSYDAWTATMALLGPHPALKAVAEAGSPADEFLGDDTHHNGAFRLSYAFETCAVLASNDHNTPYHFDRPDTYDWYLALGPISNVNGRYFHSSVPCWNDLVSHPNLDEYWRRRAISTHLTRATIPTLNVAGWWDQENFYGPFKLYESLERRDVGRLNRLVVGPWNHGGWGADGRRLA